MKWTKTINTQIKESVSIKILCTFWDVFQRRIPQPGYFIGSPTLKPYTKCMLSWSSFIRSILSNTSVQHISKPQETNRQMSPTPALISIRPTVSYIRTKLNRGHSSLKSIMLSQKSVVYRTFLLLWTLEHAPKILPTCDREVSKVSSNANDHSQDALLLSA